MQSGGLIRENDCRPDERVASDSWVSTPAEAGCPEGWQEDLGESIPMSLRQHPRLGSIASKLASQHRLSHEDGLLMMNDPDLPSVLALADISKRARYGSSVFFNSNLHINQTNVCVLACRFCAFRRGVSATDAYSLDIDEYLARLAPFSEYIDEVHTVGGLHPEWTIEHYEMLFSSIKQNYPHVSVKALTAVEIKHLATISHLSISQTLTRLRDSGLDILPGGGAEILSDDVRDIICRGKESSGEYLHIHRTAHELGIPSNCTMLFGTIETDAGRVDHLISLRELQDESGGFQCFVPYPFLPDHTRLPQAQLASANEVLRIIAVSRLLMDNIPHIKAYRMNIGDRLAQLALGCGADDIDGTVGHEEIMHSAGSTTSLSDGRSELARLIRDAGYTPVQRDSIYTNFRRYQDPPPPGRSQLPVANQIVAG